MPESSSARSIAMALAAGICVLCRTSPAGETVPVKVLYEQNTVTNMFYEDAKGRRTFDRWQLGTFNVPMRPGPGRLGYLTGHERPGADTRKWHGVRFTVPRRGITAFPTPWRNKAGKILPVGELRQAGPFVLAISEGDPPSGIPIAVTSHPQLFLDDYLIAEKVNLSRRMQRPKKHSSNPILPYEHPWEQVRIMSPAVIYEPQAKKFRMWYTAWGAPAGKNPAMTCYAESADGLTWRKPMMRIRAYRGRMPTNIVLMDPVETLALNIVHTPHDPRRPYKAVFAHRRLDGNPNFHGCAATASADGLHWDPPKIIAPNLRGGHPCVLWHAPTRRYLVYDRAWVRHPELPGHIRVTGVTESPDFKRWAPRRILSLTAKEKNFPYVQFHATYVTVYGDLLLGIPSVIYLEKKGNNKLGKKNIQLMCSRDGSNWRRIADRGVFMDNGPAGSWDGGQMNVDSLVRKGDTLYIYYSGFLRKHGQKGGETRTDRVQIGLATLPADRFVALRQVRADRPGVLPTRSMTFEGGDLLVNADAGPGDLQVEVLDAKGRAMAGFERGQSRLVRRDRLRYEVVWANSAARRSLRDAAAGGPLALRFYVNKGSLYAFQIAGRRRREAPAERKP